RAGGGRRRLAAHLRVLRPVPQRRPFRVTMTTSKPAGAPAQQAPAKNMVWIPGGTFLMGSDLPGYPEENPAHHVAVDGCWMDQHAVTVAEFRRFVQATGYVTIAERALDPSYYPDLDPAMLVPG